MAKSSTIIRVLSSLIFVIVGIKTTSAGGNLKACFDCICRGKNDCGITYAFWTDSGKPCPPGINPDSDNAYAACLSDPVCPRESMEAYYTKFQQDCNHDGKINCYDYARIHIFGGFGCIGTDNYELQKIMHCLG